MNLNIIYGQGAADNAAPSGFYTALNYVVNYFDTLFTNNVTININVSYGWILDSSTNTYNPVTKGLGESGSVGNVAVSYASTRNVLLGENAPGSNTLPSISPEPSSYSLYVPGAEAKALGFLSATDTALDGSVGFNSTASLDFTPNTTPAANQYYLVGSIEHEISEVMGRTSLLNHANEYHVIDLYRYSAPHVLQTGTGAPSYFSINSGVTNLDNWNNFQTGNTGDLADWARSAAPDAFLDDSAPGVINKVTPTDILLMQALGWTTGGPTVTSVTASADNHATSVSAGHLVTITMTTNEFVTVTGTPTLQLNDNEVAGYTGGSGTNTLTFTYAVQPGDNVADLQVTGLNLPSGAAIQDLPGNSLLGPVTSDLGIQIDTATVPPTSIQQEILGLYGALYNRASDFGGYSYWVNIVAQQADGAGVTTANAGTTAVTTNDAAVLGQLFVNTQSSYFNSVYGGLSDSAFINAMYVNIGGNAGDPGGVSYWTTLLQQAETAGQSVQAARAGLVGQFVHDLIDYNINDRPAGFTDAQWLAAEQRQEAIDNKVAVSLAYSNASQQPGGSILDVQTVGDAAYEAATTVLQGVSYNPATVTAAILGINAAVAAQNLLLI
jgi:hypothetical protein